MATAAAPLVDTAAPAAGPSGAPLAVVADAAAALLAAHGDHELLRLVVVGSVDDGKSTLIGRLLYECDGLFDDQIAAARRASKGGELDLSLFTDGLLAEREQGITIDVAYRYLTASAFGRRKLIIADTPGHVQYTRNMATGASTADAAVILVDARQGVLAQTRRHATIAGLLGIPYLAVAINKMDLVAYDRATFDRLAAEVLALTTRLGFAEVRCFPISATRGDGVTTVSPNLPWHDQPLLAWLAALPHQARQEQAPFRFVVQQVLRPDQDHRLLAGRVASGEVRVGDTVALLPSSRTATVAQISTMNGDLEAARAPLSVAIALDRDVDVGRGDILAHPATPPETGTAIDADLVWLSERPLALGRRYLVKLGARTVPAHVERIHHRLDLDTLREVHADHLDANDLGLVRVVTTRSLIFDRYRDNRATGAFVLIDPEDHATIAAGMVQGAVASTGAHQIYSHLTTADRARRLGHHGCAVLLDGGLDADATDRVAALERALFARGVVVTQVGLDVEAAVALARAGLVALAVVAGGGRERARDALRGAGVPWVEAAADPASADAIAAAARLARRDPPGS